MSLSSIATFLVLPPMNLLAVAGLGVLLSFHTRRTGQVLALASLLALAGMSTPLASGWLTSWLEDGLPLRPDPANPPAAIVVLGGDVDRQADGSSLPGPLSLERVRTGAALARSTGLPLLVTGGYTSEDTAPVCAVMADSLHNDFGVDVRWRECRSADTWENAALSAPMLRAAGIGSVYVVTHAWHMRRAIASFAPTGLAVTAAPAGTDAPPVLRPDTLVPGMKSMQRAYWAVHEWVGLLYYEWRVRQG